jgi:hypothetical protein
MAITLSSKMKAVDKAVIMYEQIKEACKDQIEQSEEKFSKFITNL